MNLETGTAIADLEVVDCPLADPIPDVGTWIVGTRIAGLTVREHVRQSNFLLEIAEKVPARFELRGRRTIAAELRTLPPDTLRIREIPSELHRDTAPVESVRRP